MNMTSVKARDIVLCDVRGDRFYGHVTQSASAEGGLYVESLTGRPIPAYFVKSRQVVAHWRQRNYIAELSEARLDDYNPITDKAQGLEGMGER